MDDMEKIAVRLSDLELKEIDLKKRVAALEVATQRLMHAIAGVRDTIDDAGRMDIMCHECNTSMDVVAESGCTLDNCPCGLN